MTVRRRVLRVRDGEGSYRPDTPAAEEPMEIRVGVRALTVTMRTPGDDFDLAAGFLVSEGVVRAAGDVAGIPLLAAVSAPSSLAVDLAEESGLTLVGSLRGASMNVYTGAGRLGPRIRDLTGVPPGR